MKNNNSTVQDCDFNEIADFCGSRVELSEIRKRLARRQEEDDISPSAWTLDTIE